MKKEHAVSNNPTVKPPTIAPGRLPKPPTTAEANAFNRIMDAFRLPKQTKNDKIKRHQAIQEATKSKHELKVQPSLAAI